MPILTLPRIFEPIKVGKTLIYRKAGLGEYGRLGLLITPEFGPRVRIGKIFTDLPLSHDEPRSFVVEPPEDMQRLSTLLARDAEGTD